MLVFVRLAVLCHPQCCEAELAVSGMTLDADRAKGWGKELERVQEREGGRRRGVGNTSMEGKARRREGEASHEQIHTHTHTHTQSDRQAVKCMQECFLATVERFDRKNR